MKPKRIFLIRHGESTGNADGNVHVTTPDWRIPLSEQGRSQAQKAGRALANELSVYGVYVSPYARTLQTWNEIKSQLPFTPQFVKEDPRLREQEWGHLRTPERDDVIDAERQAYGRFFYRMPDGESGADVYDRCTGFLDTLYRDFQKATFPENVLIVTHGFTLRVLLMRWLHWSVEEFHSLANPPNCARFELRLDESDHYRLTEAFQRKP